MTDTRADLGPEQRGNVGYLVGVCLVATLGGLLFGYDTAVIAGAIGFLQTHFDLSAAMKGWAASSALAGCVGGVLLAGPISDRLGRRKALLMAAVMFLVSAIGTAVPRSLTMFVIFRFVGGLGVGAASMTSPMYIAEISPARIRGRLVSVNQLAIIFGMLIVYFVNYFIGMHGISVDQRIARQVVTPMFAAMRDQGQTPALPSHGELIVRLAAELPHHVGIPDREGVRRDVAVRLTCRLALDQARDALGDNRPAVPETVVDLICPEMCGALRETGGEIGPPTIDEVARRTRAAIDSEYHEYDEATFDRLIRVALQRFDEYKLLRHHLQQALSRHGRDAWNVRVGWRWMFGSESIPASLLLVLLWFVPESPRWLVKQGHEDEARKFLTRVDGREDAEQEMERISVALAQEPASLGQLLSPGLRVALTIGVVLAVLQQVTGINVFLYYAPEILKTVASSTVDVALLQTILVGGVNLLFTLIAIWTVDRIGRKPLMIAGAAGMGISLAAIGIAAYLHQLAGWVLIFILGYIACFALSVGPVTWVILSEIFPTKIRGRALAISTLWLWVANFIVSQTFPMLDENQFLVDKFNHGFPFWIYGAFCVVLVAFTIVAVPETKGKTLEEIEQCWLKEHIREED